MSVQIIERDGQPEYAVLPWDDYQALLSAAGHKPAEVVVAAAAQPATFALSQLRELREARQMDLEQLARSVGISPHYLGMIERGERQPDGAIQRALERLFAQPEEARR